MLKLNASYSKKVPAEGEYTSQSYHASIEVELPDGLVPVIASGGAGQYIAMPIRTISKNPIPTNKENKEMETENTHVVEPQDAAPVVNPLDELGTAIEDFKLKIKAMFEESTVLSRKVKEVALIQKQKERDFIQARRAIERIRMAI